MIDGMSIATFTAVHVSFGLVGIISGLVVLVEMTQGKLAKGWTFIFLVTTVLASGTGFGIPPVALDLPRILGMLSLGLLAVTIAGLYSSLAGHWRWIYIVSAVTALYLNCFMAVAQAFSKLAVLKALARPHSWLPFVITQLVLFAMLAGLAILAARKFRPAAGSVPMLMH